jgi:hypothetical protein
MNSSLGIPDGARPKWAALGYALTDARVTIPCADSDDWTDERPEIRFKASRQCGGCPVLAECGSYADAAKERHGVWAAVDRTKPKSSRPKRLAS